MGTRAQFFIGNPENTDGRTWLGCVAWDGYPDGDIGDFLKNVGSEGEFREAVGMIAQKRDDFCDPAVNDFPFPWRDDLFLTDFTYAFFDGKVQATSFHTGWSPLSEHLSADDDWFDAYNDRNELSSSVPAPLSTGKPSGPDSIMIISA